MRLAVIPARGGSKRIPRKNIKAFNGQPMIAWSIQAAQQSGCFDRVVVSTDDAEIAQIAEQYGAEVPFIRPAELSDDFTITADVIAHAITELVPQAEQAKATVCCIYATAPFIQHQDILESLEILTSGDWKFSFPVTDFAAPIFRSFQLMLEGGIEMFFPEHFTTRSQDLPEAWHDTGQFYWGTCDAWLSKQAIFSAWSKPLPIPRWRVQDIDTEADWQRAEMLAELIKAQ